MAANAGMKEQKGMSLTPTQLATLLVLEGQVAQLQVGANQLGGWLQLKQEADVLLEAAILINKRKTEMQQEWSSAVRIVSPSSVPGLVVGR